MLTPDAQHKKLHALCQQAGKLVTDDTTDSAAFHALLNDLAIFAREHFNAEEERLRQTDPTQLHERLAEHIAYESQLMDILIAASDGILDTRRLHRFLTEWWSFYSLQSAPPIRETLR